MLSKYVLSLWRTPGLFLLLFPSMVVSFWDRVGIMLGSFWDHVGIVSGSCFLTMSDCFGIVVGSCWGEIALGSFGIMLGGDRFGGIMLGGDRFGIGLGAFWGRFGIVFGSFWDRFGVGSGSCLGRLGVLLASFGHRF